MTAKVSTIGKRRRHGLLNEVRQVFADAEAVCGCGNPDFIDDEQRRILALGARGARPAPQHPRGRAVTRLAFLADVHLGNHRRFGGAVESSLNRRCRQALDVFGRALLRAATHQCDAVVIVGDLFDTAKPEPQLIAEVQACIEAAQAQHRQMRVIALVGNHDQVSSAIDDHALGPLAPCAEVLSEPGVLEVGDVDLVCLPFKTGPAKDWLAPTLARTLAAHGGDAGGKPTPPGRPRLLALHLGIADASTAPWLRDAHDAINVDTLSSLCALHGIEAAFAGNWHDRKLYDPAEMPGRDTIIFQLGALVPTGFDNPGLYGYGTLGLWEDGEVEFEELTGPRFLKVGNDDSIDLADLRDNKTYLSVRTTAEKLGAVTAHVAASVERGDIVDGEVLVDEAEAQAEARTAAQVARSAETMEEALALYIEEMPLAEGVDREAVLARSKRYLESTT